MELEAPETSDAMETPGNVQNAKISYPRGAIFLIWTEFCERFTFYGIRGILVLYLNRFHFYSRKTTTIIYHSFNGFGYFTCILGAVVADGYTGKFCTIVSSKIVYILGCILLVLGSIDQLHLHAKTSTILGLMLIAIGSGAMKPCISAFCGDQFHLPEQEKQMSIFFSIFYFSVNAGALVAMFSTPLIYSEIQCFGKTTCFALAFGLPTIALLIGLGIFLIGYSFYHKGPPSGSKCILFGFVVANALIMQCKEHKTNPRDHFLDYAQEKYGNQLVQDVKALLRQMVLYFPAPVFWALFEQKGSRWIFQATKMDLKVRSITIKPEHMQIINPVLILLFIPLFQYVVYPILSAIGIRRPLQKLTIGGFLTGCSFLVAGIIELNIQPTFNEYITAGRCHLRLFNGLTKCMYKVQTTIPNTTAFSLAPLSYFEEKRVMLTKENKHFFRFHSSSPGCADLSKWLHLTPQRIDNFYIHGSPRNPVIESYTEKKMHNKDGMFFVRPLFQATNITDVYMIQEGSKNRLKLEHKKVLELDSATYFVFIGGKKVSVHYGVYDETLTLIIRDNDVTKLSIIPGDRLHVFWQFPQYILMSMGEVMFSITGLEFSYSQAPVSMKSVLQACWLITVAIGNLLVIFIAKLSRFRSMANEFFLFAALMFLSMIVFMFLAYRYIPNNPNSVSNNDIEND